MNAEFLQRAGRREHWDRDLRKTVYRWCAAIIQLDGVQWSSSLPETSGEAQSYNDDAERIVEAVKSAGVGR